VADGDTTSRSDSQHTYLDESQSKSFIFGASPESSATQPPPAQFSLPLKLLGSPGDHRSRRAGNENR
jgi:hypothetical protein